MAWHGGNSKSINKKIITNISGKTQGVVYLEMFKDTKGKRFPVSVIKP